ncbi:mCG1037648, partial [Mus musculus]
QLWVPPAAGPLTHQQCHSRIPLTSAAERSDSISDHHHQVMRRPFLLRTGSQR